MQTKQRSTREEKAAADQAARRARAIAEFREGFLKDQGRRVYRHATAWQDATAPDGHGDRTVLGLYSLVDEFNRLGTQLRRELDSLVEEADAARKRLADGRDPFFSSNGICARYYEVDKYGHQIEALRRAIAATARATGWRVREIESATEREKADGVAGLRVIKTAGGEWIVSRDDSAGATTWLQDDGTFGQGNAFYATEDLAWAALAVVVTGRAL